MTPLPTPPALPYRKGAMDPPATTGSGASRSRGDWLVVLVIFGLLASLARWSGLIDRAVEVFMGFAPHW